MGNNIIINESCSNIRALGREALRGKWAYAAIATLLYVAVVIIPVLILDGIFGTGEEGSVVSSIYSILVTGPLTLGYTMFALSIFRRIQGSIAEIFYGFESFGKALGLHIVRMIFVFLWALLFIIPGIIASLRYSLCFFVLADNPNIGIMESINESKRLMYGNKWKLFCLYLSFIGWAILASLSLGLGYLWLYPYMQVSLAAFYDMAKGNLMPVEKIQLTPEL